MIKKATLNVNGAEYTLSIEVGEMLLDVLRDKLGLIGTKKGCSSGDCGACTVLVDGVPVTSCLVLAVSVEGKQIETIEGLGTEEHLHPLQQSFIEHGAIQCGYCTPGLLLTAKALLAQVPEPTELEVREAIAGNLCRCTGYSKVVDAVLAASRKIVGEKQ
jgi:carbon-monoxide dehydrogenase small subunit